MNFCVRIEDEFKLHCFLYKWPITIYLKTFFLCGASVISISMYISISLWILFHGSVSLSKIQEYLVGTLFITVSFIKPRLVEDLKLCPKIVLVKST